VGAQAPTSTQPTTPARPSGPTQPAAAAQPTALTAPAAYDQPFEARLAQAYLEGYRAAQHQGTGTPFRAHPSPAVADLAALGGRLASALAAPGSAAAVVASLAALASGATLIAAYVFHLGLPRQDAIIFAMFCGTVALFAAAPSLAPRAGRTGALALRAAQVGMLVDTLAAAYLAQRQFYDPRLPEAWIPIAISMLGACLLGSGLLIVGLFTLRRGLLTRWQFAPLLLGLATLAGIANTAPCSWPNRYPLPARASPPTRCHRRFRLSPSSSRSPDGSPWASRSGPRPPRSSPYPPADRRASSRKAIP
jgi:hypothetical protein